jgi:hypothetical protein
MKTDMKTMRTFLMALGAAALAGCAATSTTVVTEPVGPDLARPKINVEAGQGRLLVYTARDVGIGDPVAYFPTHSAYRILNDDGTPLRTVDNRSSTFDQQPLTVTLPVGKYKVKGRATNAGEVIVPVVVAENKTTVVDLEGSVFPQHGPTGAGQWIRLPDGKVIGMREE